MNPNLAISLQNATTMPHVVAGLPFPESRSERRATPGDVTLHLARHYFFVQFYPALAAKLGSFKAALFMGHALYWTRHLAEKDPRKDGWFYLSAKQCEAATGLTTSEQGGVRRLLRELGLIEEKRAGVPATMHYRINLPAMLEWAGLHKAWRGADALTAIETWLGDSIRFYKPLADCAGSVAGGLYLSLLVQKQREWMATDGFSHVPQQRISELLAWGTKTQRNAREKLKTCGLLQERQRGAWIRVDMDELLEQLSPGWHENINDAPRKADTKAKMENAVFSFAPAVRTGAVSHAALPSAQIMLAGRKQQMSLFGDMAPNSEIRHQATTPPADSKCRRMFELPVQRMHRSGRTLRAKAQAAFQWKVARQAVSTKGQVAPLSKLPPKVDAATTSVLVMPKEMNSALHEVARRTVAGLALNEQQMLLDELAGQMSAKRIGNPIGYLYALVKKHKEGGLVPALAGQVADDRAHRAKLLALQAQRESAAGATPNVSEREVAAAKARLQKLRVAMEAGMAAPGRRKVA